MSARTGLALDRRAGSASKLGRKGRSDRIEKNGKRTVLADRFEGRQLNGTERRNRQAQRHIYYDTYGGLRCARRTRA